MDNKHSVLVINDSPAVRSLTASVLSAAGYEVCMAEDGDIGLENARREIPSIILVDFIMPRMNGFQFCKSIRSIPVLKEVRIILITSMDKEERQGFDDKFGIARFLQKPFEDDVLIQTVKDVLAVSEEEPGAAPEDTDAEVVPVDTADTESDQYEFHQLDTLSADIAFVNITTPDVSFTANASHDRIFTETSLNDSSDDELIPGKQSVLVIDDSPTVRMLAESVLSEAGYEVFLAEDGDIGLEIARREIPSIILVDFIMPKMNGFQLCKSIRSDPVLNEVPIILITSRGKEVGQGFDDKFGIARFLQKPFEADVLIQTVKDVLAGSEEESGVAPENTGAEIVPEYKVANMGTGLHTSFVTDTSLPHAPDAETPGTEKEQVETVNAEVLEKVSKDIKSYFGQELPVMIKSIMIQALKETDFVQSSRRILSGDITYISCAEIFQLISTSGLSGKLSIVSNNFSSEMYLEGGHIVFASISKRGHRTYLEELIVNDGKDSRSNMQEIFSQAGDNTLTAGSMLLDKGMITLDELKDYYRRISEDAVHDLLSAETGHFYLEDVPLPREIQGFTLRIPASGVIV